MPKGVYKRTEEMKMKLRVKKFPNRKRPILSEEHKAKIRLLNEKTRFKNGHKHSLETLRKLSNSLKGRVSPRKGVKLTEETIEKMRNTALERFKDKTQHPNWRGGVSKDKAHYARKRRMKKLGNSGSHTLGEWENLKAQYNWTCPSCKRKEPNIKLTEDHIVPVSKGGSDNIENIQPLCKSCNCRKHDKIIKYKLEN